MTLTPTSSQTVGPFFHLGVSFLTREHLEARGIAGELVTIRGRVLDGDGKPLPDALLEIWQADAAGRYAADRSDAELLAALPGFRSRGNRSGWRFLFHDRKARAGAVSRTAVCRRRTSWSPFFRAACLKPLWTRVYFPDEPGNAADPILKLVPPERRATLIARRSGESAGTLAKPRAKILSSGMSSCKATAKPFFSITRVHRRLQVTTGGCISRG